MRLGVVYATDTTRTPPFPSTLPSSQSAPGVEAVLGWTHGFLARKRLRFHALYMCGKTVRSRSREFVWDDNLLNRGL